MKTMNKTQDYAIIKPRSTLPVRTLITIPNGAGELTVGFPAFGPSYFSENVK